MQYIEKGTADYRKVSLCLFLGGFVTFAIMNGTQPLLPVYSKQFHISPATASLSLSITTATLAIMLTVAAAFSNAIGRKSIMVVSLFAASALAIATALSPNFVTLLVIRALEGIVLAGVPAIGMTYLSEEVSPRHLGAAMGMYIGGNAMGGMIGRLVIGLLTDFYSWRIALGFMGIVGLVCAALFYKTLPSSTHFVARPFSLKKHVSSLLTQFRDPGLLCLYGMGFLMMGSFVTLYSYMGYQLIAQPYNLSQTWVSWIFIVYIVGTFGSNWLGSLADRLPRHKIIWTSIALMLAGVVCTLHPLLVLKITGMIFVTFAFFGSHSIASSWVGKRAGRDRAQASALYLFFTYVGSSCGNSLGGVFWSTDGWLGVAGMMGLFIMISLLLSVVLNFIPKKAITALIETGQHAIIRTGQQKAVKRYV